MKKYVLVCFGILLSFFGGLTVNYSSHAENTSRSQSNAPVAQAVSTPTPCSEPEQSPGLLDDSYITKFNGVAIDLGYGGAGAEDVPWVVESAEITPLSNGDMLVNMGDTLYRLDDQRHVIWSYVTAQMVFDYAYVESTDLVYVTAGDNTMLILNATSGAVEFSDSRNGSAAFGVAGKYGDDMCLVTDNFVMYREKVRHDNIEPMKDGITCWRGTTILWHLDFPPDANLVVNGKRILAVTKSSKATYVNEIVPPQAKSK
ncbi:MAG TPA: hypothetical protein VGN90_02295 [Pyrinomonadaceae bacterium]|jgi:hypothetical protein|nr:hypothetical protein [Pyrinomonadaceae bacterium]